MIARRLLHILPLLALPSLVACGSGNANAPLPPPSALSLAAVSDGSGVDRMQLGRAIDALFDADSVGETRALLVLRGGRIVAQRYGEGYGPDMRMLGWSASECVTGILIGLIVSDGQLRLDESVPVPAWQRPGDPRGEITLRQLLQMRSGLRVSQAPGPAYNSDTARMLFLDGHDDMAAFAEAQPLSHEPGRVFQYSPATSVILADVAARVLAPSGDAQTRRKVLGAYLKARLLDPAGMKSLVSEYDAAGTMTGSTMIHASARDWARLGEFLRNFGSVKGAQVVPRRWIEFMLSPSPRNPGYGAQVWLNRPPPDGKELLFPGKAPASLFACIGHMGQYVIGSPAQKLTVVRLGNTPDKLGDTLRDKLGDLVALFPRSQT